MTRTAAAPALLALVLLVGTAGCGGSEPKADTRPKPTAGTTSSASGTPSPTGAPSPSPTGAATDRAGTGTAPFPADTRPDDGGFGSGNGLGLTRVRVARNTGFDRVVFDLGGTGTPGWHVEYVKRPVADGSGAPVRVKGTAYLQVVLHGLGLPDDTGVPAYGDSRTRVPGTGTRGVAEVAPGGVFEGDLQAFIGLKGSKRPFRVFALRNPTRVVVDVRDD